MRSRLCCIAMGLVLTVLVGCHPAVESSGARKTKRVAGCTVALDGSNLTEVDDCLSLDAGELRVAPALLGRLKLDDDGLVNLWNLRFYDSNDVPPSITRSFGAWATREGRAIVVPTFDNGPDYFAEGLVRFVAPNGKIGFADKKLAIAIPATFDWATPFASGQSEVCRGCIVVREGTDEHSQVRGGVRAVIDRSGRVVSGDAGIE